MPSIPKKTIAVVPYNPRWPEQFTQEAAKLQAALGKVVRAIHHVGSTAVPGLAAKRDLDIVLVISNIQNALLLQDIGYVFKGELNIPLRYFFSKNTAETKVNLHVCEPDHGFIALQLAFRDWLRTHEADKNAYQNVKYELLKNPESGTRVRSAFTPYSLGKDAIIKAILRKSGYNGLILNFCLHDREWEAARWYRDTYFFRPENMEDPYTWTFDHEDHKHFVLYKGVDIIGYAHVQLWPGRRAAIRMIAIAAEKRGNSYGTTLMGLLEKWLRVKGYHSVHIESAPEVIEFYEHLAYVRMPFNDPTGHEGYPDDIAVGKLLKSL